MLELTYELKFDTPVHVGAGYGFATFLDNVVVRDGQGHVYLPGSSLKGKARAAARRLTRGLSHTNQPCSIDRPCNLLRSAPCPICRLFGGRQFPGRVHFDNIQLPQSYRTLLENMANTHPLLARQATTQQRTHVMLNRRQRTARPDHLFTNELVNAHLPFIGQIASTAPAGLEDLAILWGALRLITHIGRARGRGLGRCTLTPTHLTLNNTPYNQDHCIQTLKTLQPSANSHQPTANGKQKAR